MNPKTNTERSKKGRGITSRRLNSVAVKQRYPAKTLWSRAYHRAQTKGLEFNISVEDIKFPTCCPYLGVELTWVQGQGRLPYNYSLDRIDNGKGYVKGNIQVISCRANTMKQDASEEELTAFAKGVLKLTN